MLEKISSKASIQFIWIGIGVATGLFWASIVAWQQNRNLGYFFLVLCILGVGIVAAYSIHLEKSGKVNK